MRKGKASTEFDTKAIGRRIRELRGFDVTQAQFARLLGITQAQLSRIEHGKRAPSAEILLRLRSKFNKSVDWILTGSEVCVAKTASDAS